MRIRYFLIGAIFLSVFGTGITSGVFERDAEAKCRILSVKNSLEESKAVFTGEVVAEEKTGDVKQFTFRIDKYWKGGNKKEADVFVYQTTRYQSPFKEGEKFLVFAREDGEGKLTVSRCSRSKELSYAEDDLSELGAGKVPR